MDDLITVHYLYELIAGLNVNGPCLHAHVISLLASS